MYWAGSSGCPPICDLFNSRYGQLNLQEKERKNMKYIRFWLYVIFWVFVLQKAKCREKYIWFRLHAILCPGRYIWNIFGEYRWNIFGKYRWHIYMLVPREGLQSKKRVTKLVLAIILVFTGISETAILTYSVNIIQKIIKIVWWTNEK